MTSIVSAISGQFSKSLILGTFLPSMLFVVLGVFFVLPLFPYNWDALQQLSGAETQSVLVASLVTVVLTGLLYNLNIPVIRFYEGYTWQNSLIGEWRTRHYLGLHAAARGLRPLLRDVQVVVSGLARSEEDDATRAAREELDQRLRAARARSTTLALGEFPVAAGSVLPTKLGNVIRSFENYPSRQYHLAAITLWPRLVAKIDKDYGEQVDNAKTSFDFMINCSLLSFALALLVLFVGLWYPVMFVAPRHWAVWLSKVLLLLALSCAFYRSSIGRAAEWGEMVKGAFDLYRHELLAQLGYKTPPSSLEGERRLWDSISQQLIYGDAPRGAQLPPYKDSATSVRCEPETVRLKLIRGLTPTADEGVYAVTLRVANSDAFGRDAVDVVLTDSVPEGFAYVWDSAERVSCPGDTTAAGTPAAADPVFVSGAGTMRFDIGTLAAGGAACVGYRVVRYDKEDSGP